MKNPMINDIVTGNSDGGYNWDNLLGDFLTGGAVSQADVNEWNKGFQEQQFAYQKWLNELTMEREDSSMQRRVEDLKKAGLHPVLATGQGATATSMSAGNSAPPMNAGFNNKFGIADILQIMTATSQIQKTNAEAGYVEELAKSVKDKTAAEVSGLLIDNKIKDYDFQKAFENGLFYNKSGLAYEFLNVLDLLKNKNGYDALVDVFQNQTDGTGSKIADAVENITNGVKDTAKGGYQKVLDRIRDDIYTDIKKKGKVSFSHTLKIKSLIKSYERANLPVPPVLIQLSKSADMSLKDLYKKFGKK